LARIFNQTKEFGKEKVGHPEPEAELDVSSL
jgi:hypothetical protein